MAKYDVVGLGNAIVDVLARVDEKFLADQGLVKGAMTLIDEQQANALYANMPPAVERSGGSAANTMAGIASFGGKAAFMGKVRDDALGDIFVHDLRAVGVHYDTAMATSGSATARSFVSVTPDADRTMATYLGACKEITVDDIDEDLIADAKVLYLEGYLWDEEHAKLAMRKAIECARRNGVEVALSLSDGFCVERHRHEFKELIDGGVSILFANEDEMMKLMGVDDLDSVLESLGGYAQTNIVTLGEMGSIVVCRNGRAVDSDVPDGLNVVDTTGAGDLYASGFLYGYTRNYSIQRCADLGTIAASEIIQHLGARPESSLAELGKAA